MKKLFKGVALTLAAIMTVASAQLAVFADDDVTEPQTSEEQTTQTQSLPSATVTELYGADLNVDLNPDYSAFTGIDGGEYAMNKAVTFATDYPDTPEGNALKQAELATYGDWICDFRITLCTPTGTMSGDELMLVGNYGTYGDVGFRVSKLAQLAGKDAIDSKPTEYYLMQVIGLATGNAVSSNLTYEEVVNNVKVFKCGVVDDDLPLDSYVKVQLVMFEDRDRTICHEIGDYVLYTKTGTSTEETVQVGTLDATVEETQAEGVTGLTVEGIKDSIIATEKTKIINDYIVENNIEAVAGAETVVNVDIFAKTEAIENTANSNEKFQLTPYAKITCVGHEDKEVAITNDQLKQNAEIAVTIPVTAEPLYIIHATDEGTLIDKYTIGSGDKQYTYTGDADGGTCQLTISHFSTLEAVTSRVEVTDVDAYIDNDGYGNIRFISTYKDNEPIEAYGTWIVTNGYLDNAYFDNSITTNKAAKYYSDTTGIAKYGDTFSADLMKIPTAMVGTTFYAKSFITRDNVTGWSAAMKAGSVNQYKNYTSANLTAED
ncbi:MAG: hypothetical protein IJT23_04460 [Clostridia bacterium]|nr:hypothetical protein [Clostridia bacterium]